MTDWSTLKKLIWLRIIKGGGSALRTVTGALIHVTNALALPAEALSVNVEPIQAGTGDPSPDNVRPISGRTSATVTRTGKNLFSSEVVHGLWTALGVFYSHEGSSTKYIATKNIIPVVGGETYTLSYINDTNNNIASISYSAYRNGEIIVGGKYITVANGIIDVPSGTDSITLNFILTNNITSISEVTTSSFQIELGSTATAYEPYAGTTYTIQFGDTVYGGTLDVTAGKMVVDRAMLDVTNSNWRMISVPQGTLFRTQQSIIGTEYNSTDVVCSKYPTVLSASRQNKSLACGTANVIDIIDSDYNSVTDFKTANANTQIVYPLAQPIEITLTPTQIDMLLGENNLWSDAGDSTLTYYAEGEASTSEALGILLGGTYNNPGGADDVSDDEALGILLGR